MFYMCRRSNDYVAFYLRLRKTKVYVLFYKNVSSHVHKLLLFQFIHFDFHMYVDDSYLFWTFFYVSFFQNYTRVHSDCQNERSVRNFQSNI